MSVYFLGEIAEELIKEYQDIITCKSSEIKLKDHLELSDVENLFVEVCTDRKMFRMKCILQGIQPRHLADIEDEACRRLGLYSKFPGWEKIEKIKEE